MQKTLVRYGSMLLLALAMAPAAKAQDRVTPPEAHFGHQVGADYVLFNYEALHDYFITLANESDRMVLDTLGYTEDGDDTFCSVIDELKGQVEFLLNKVASLEAELSPVAMEEAPEEPKRKGGRPKGSKNKLKAELVQ